MSATMLAVLLGAALTMQPDTTSAEPTQAQGALVAPSPARAFRWYVDLAAGLPVLGTTSGVGSQGAIDRRESLYVTLRVGRVLSPSWAFEAFAVSSQQYTATDVAGRGAGLLVMGAGVGGAWTTPWSRRVSLAAGAGIGLPLTSEASATVFSPSGVNQAEAFADAAAPLLYGEARWDFPRGPWTLGLRAGVRMGIHVGPSVEAGWNSTMSRFDSGGFIVDFPVSAALRYRL